MVVCQPSDTNILANILEAWSQGWAGGGGGEEGTTHPEKGWQREERQRRRDVRQHGFSAPEEVLWALHLLGNKGLQHPLI